MLQVEERIVVDDRNLSDMEKEGWEYYSPREFVEKWEGKM